MRKGIKPHRAGAISLLRDLSIPMLWSLMVRVVFLWYARHNWRPFWEVSNWELEELAIFLLLFCTLQRLTFCCSSRRMCLAREIGLILGSRLL